MGRKPIKPNPMVQFQKSPEFRIAYESFKAGDRVDFKALSNLPYKISQFLHTIPKSPLPATTLPNPIVKPQTRIVEKVIDPKYCDTLEVYPGDNIDIEISDPEGNKYETPTFALERGDKFLIKTKKGMYIMGKGRYKE